MIGDHFGCGIGNSGFASSNPQHFAAHIAREGFGRCCFGDWHDKNITKEPRKGDAVLLAVEPEAAARQTGSGLAQWVPNRQRSARTFSTSACEYSVNKRCISVAADSFPTKAKPRTRRRRVVR